MPAWLKAVWAAPNGLYAHGLSRLISCYGPTADWYRNVLAAGGAQLNFGRGASPAAYRIPSPEEAERIFRDYDKRNWLIRPGVRLTLTLLLGWRFDGSDDAVARMVRQLPMVAFRPRTVGS